MPLLLSRRGPVTPAPITPPMTAATSATGSHARSRPGASASPCRSPGEGGRGRSKVPRPADTGVRDGRRVVATGASRLAEAAARRPRSAALGWPRRGAVAGRTLHLRGRPAGPRARWGRAPRPVQWGPREQREVAQCGRSGAGGSAAAAVVVRGCSVAGAACQRWAAPSRQVTPTCRACRQPIRARAARCPHSCGSS